VARRAIAGLWMMRGDMAHGNRGKVIPGTDVTHFFDLSPKVGQRGPDYREISMRKIDRGSPGWIRTSQILLAATRDKQRSAAFTEMTAYPTLTRWLSQSGSREK
jgi:hypothetical protein